MRDSTAIVPIRPWDLAIRRLHPSETVCAALAQAFAQDVIRAVADSTMVGHVVIVAARSDLGLDLSNLGVTFLRDSPLLSADAINDAIVMGRRWASARRAGRGVVVIPADLPALTGASLDTAIELMAGHSMSFIPDARGQGTTLLSAARPELLQPSYGRSSAAAHRANGFWEVADAPEGCRLDVDTPPDLREVQRLGVGEFTSSRMACFTDGERSD